MPRPTPMYCAVLTVLLAVPSLAPAADEAIERRLMAGAESRIEKHRKADATVTVVDAAGQPVSDFTVEIEQTRHAFLFGSNIFAWDKIRDADVQAAYRRQFADLLNFATLPYYWPSYEPRQGEPEHERYERVARWCAEQGIDTKGHPLAWNYSDPRWLPNDSDENYRLQLARIDDCTIRMQGLIDRWDVVNEATHFDRTDFLAKSPKLTAMWQSVGQIEFTKACFEQARKAVPNAELLINDYRTDPAYARLIEQLVDDQGQPLYDVIGLQSHMHGGAWSNEKLWSVCEQFAPFGVPLHFTEMTLVSGEQVGNKDRGEPWPSTPEGEARQAREVVRCYTMLFSHPAVEAITWWDFCDKNAWKGAPAGFLREDGTPKPAYAALMDHIKGDWWTETTQRSNSQGEVAFRGFLGDYSIAVKNAQGNVIDKACVLSKDGDNHWTIRLSQE